MKPLEGIANVLGKYCELLRGYCDSFRKHCEHFRGVLRSTYGSIVRCCEFHKGLL